MKAISVCRGVPSEGLDSCSRLERELGRPVVCLFTSFRYPVFLDDNDANMLESALQELDLSSGMALMINSRGGDGLSAERIINLCRAHSKTGEYWAIIPGKAKSAATMVCFGAGKIIMGRSSELGPIDPQWGPSPNGVVFSLNNVVRSYDQLFSGAVRAKGNLEPYLQQLNNYDAREIEEFRAAIGLSKDIGIRALQSGIMSGAELWPQRRVGRRGHGSLAEYVRTLSPTGQSRVGSGVQGH